MDEHPDTISSLYPERAQACSDPVDLTIEIPVRRNAILENERAAIGSTTRGLTNEVGSVHKRANPPTAGAGFQPHPPGGHPMTTWDDWGCTVQGR
ncbi:MAG: hypothetical protein NVSMB57_08270 [Actinomycetota bacterium]